MNIDGMIEGLQIVKKYTKNQHCISAEHDEIYLYSGGESMSMVDVERMRELGFFQTNDEENVIVSYNSDEGWTCFT